MLNKINLFLRSLVFMIYSLSSIVIYSFVCLFSLLLPLTYRHCIIRAFLRAYIYVLKIVCRIDYKVEGLKNIPHNRKSIVFSKHQSTWETFFLPLLFHDPAIILKKQLLWIPFFGWGLAASQPIAINRSKKKSAMQQVIEQGKKCLEAGRFILIFPEGTRIPYGKVGKYHLGGARLAAATGYPITPVAHNAGLYWPKRSFIKHPGTIRVIIGPLIETQDRSPEEIMKSAKSWIEGTIAKM